MARIKEYLILFNTNLERGKYCAFSWLYLQLVTSYFEGSQFTEHLNIKYRLNKGFKMAFILYFTVFFPHIYKKGNIN